MIVSFYGQIAAQNSKDVESSWLPEFDIETATGGPYPTILHYTKIELWKE